MLWGSLIIFFAWTFFSCIVPTTMRPFSGVKSSAMVKVRSISFWLYSLVICGSFFAATMVYMLPFQGLSLSSSLPAKKTANSYLSLPFPVFHVLVLSLLCRDENHYFFRKWWFFNAWMFKSEPLNWVLKNLLYFLSHHLSCLLPQPIFQTSTLLIFYINYSPIQSLCFRLTLSVIEWAGRIFYIQPEAVTRNC